MSDFNNKYSIPPKKNKHSEEEVFDFSYVKSPIPPKKTDTSLSYSWKAVSKDDTEKNSPQKKPLRESQIAAAEIAIEQKMFKVPEQEMQDANQNFSGKIIEDKNFAKKDLSNADFSVTDLSGADFSGANLAGANFAGANLSEANFSGADLSGAVLSGANLLKTNFTGAKLNRVTLTEANLEEAILLGIEIDDLGLEELQTLIEYMATYYPHKLNLTKLNLSLLDLSKIDLTKVSLRGVDFTGCSMKGVRIWELDLSECIISPEQIAEALGRVPSALELAKLLAPKKSKKPQKNLGEDVIKFFYEVKKDYGVWDVTNDKGLDIGKLVESGMKVFRKAVDKPKPPMEGEELVAHLKEERQSDDKNRNEMLKEKIMQRKEAERKKLAEKKQEFQQEVSRSQQEKDEEIKVSEKNKNYQMVDKMVRRDRGRE